MLLLREDVYPYECMDEWEKVNETILPEKKITEIWMWKILQIQITRMQKFSKDDINKFKWISCFLS